MPELPEMETYRKLLEQRISGVVISDVQINREKSINVLPSTFFQKVKNQRVVRIERRAKHLLFHLENGAVLLLHLMLGGFMFFGTNGEKPDRTIQIQLTFGMKHLFFIGLRLGYLHLHTIESTRKVLSDLGPEPLEKDFTLDSFLAILHKRRGRLKTKLIDQNFISGIGNCYSDEICFHAQILPTRNINKLEKNEVSQLYHSIRFVLKDATKHGGYMETPFFKGDSIVGGYNPLCKVYDRKGEACPRCHAPIKKDNISSRKTFYCPNCQK